ncbi:Cir1 protein [Starmerella bacillaris]|uniref:Probable electron transfer flavoprotein subunit beta n=1 Tax=Starmerella bacillaris TaxID=1247836 RepID=A0AAV5RM31_STABA|nr:Cir1 protein [Starmerella bacillaris]
MSNKLKILVPLKRVIDPLLKPKISASKIDLTGLKFTTNPFCDIALSEAIQLKEKNSNLVENIHAVSIGSAKSKEILVAAIAKGANSASLIETEKSVEPLAVAKLLAEVAKQQKSNLIMLGKQSIDSDANQTGQMLAALLNWPQATFASKVEVSSDGTSVEVTREVDGGSVTQKASLPMVITADLRLNNPRFVSLPKLMKAKKTKIDTKKIEEFGTDITPRLEVEKVEEPPVREPGIMVNTVEEFVAELKKRGAL